MKLNVCAECGNVSVTLQVLGISKAKKNTGAANSNANFIQNSHEPSFMLACLISQTMGQHNCNADEMLKINYVKGQYTKFLTLQSLSIITLWGQCIQD